MTRTVLITGASSGIGCAVAKTCAKHGHNVVLVARNLQKLTEIGKELEQRYHVVATVIRADLADPSSPAFIYEQIQTRNIHVDMLVNNAGFGNFGYSRKPTCSVRWN